MRTLTSVGLALSLVALAACEDSSGTGVVWRSEVGVLNGAGEGSVPLPASAGNVDRLPAVTCYVADPTLSAANRYWWAIGSVELPPVGGGSANVLSNCIVEADNGNPNRLRATIEQQPAGFLYQIVVVY